MSKALLTIIIVMMLVSCGHRVIHIDMVSERFQDKSPIFGELLRNMPDRITVDSITDARSEKALLGKFQHATVHGDNFYPWIVARLNELERFSARGHVDVELIHLDVSVKKAYIRMLPSSIGSSVVLDVNYSCGENLKKHLFSRGDAMALNWGFGQGEMMSLLNEATSEAITNIVQDMRESCDAELAVGKKPL